MNSSSLLSARRSLQPIVSVRSVRAATLLVATLAMGGVTSVSSIAAAQSHGTQTPELPQPTPPGAPGTSTVVAAPGSGGLTVVAPTAGGGSVTATGCSVVTVGGNPTYVLPDGSPCPQVAPYQPYQPYASGNGPAPLRYYDDRPSYAPRYARDSDRSAAVLASSLVFGVAGGVAGILYLNKHGDSSCSYADGTYGSGGYTCSQRNATTELVAYGAIVTFAPSIPRFVVGDTTRALVFTGLRGASILAATLIDWGGSSSNSSDDKWEMPFLLGFVAPVTLAIVDLATTPHREDLEDKPQPAHASVTGVSPVPLADSRGAHGAMMSMTGRF